MMCNPVHILRKRKRKYATFLFQPIGTEIAVLYKQMFNLHFFFLATSSCKFFKRMICKFGTNGKNPFHLTRIAQGIFPIKKFDKWKVPPSKMMILAEWGPGVKPWSHRAPILLSCTPGSLNVLALFHGPLFN